MSPADAALMAVCQLDFQAYGPALFVQVLGAFREEMIDPGRLLGETALIEHLRLVAAPDLIESYRYRAVGDLVEDLAEEAATNPEVPVRFSDLLERATNVVAHV